MGSGDTVSMSDTESYYRFHAPIYDLSRWSFLFGRSRLVDLLPDLPPEPDILDLGCGTGRHLGVLKSRYPDAHVTGLDSSAAMMKRADKRAGEQVQLKCEPYSADTFPPGSFDLILASYSLTMMPEQEKVIEAMRLHLKQGAFVLIVDFDGSRYGWFRSWMQFNHADLSSSLFSSLYTIFRQKYTFGRSVYMGLYSYRIFLGKKD